MQFELRELKAVVAKAKAFVAARSALPVLRGIRFSAVGGKVVVEATDLEAWAIISTGGETHGPDQTVVIDAKALAAAIGNGGAGKVTVGFDGSFKAGSGPGITLPIYAEADFPKTPEPDDDLVTLTGDLAELGQAAIRVAKAASSDQARPILTGICFDYDPDRGAIDLVATDSYKLGVYHSEVNSFTDRTLVPAKPLVKALQAKTGVFGRGLAIHLGKRQTWVASSQMVVYLRNIEGQFPKWRNLWPAEPVPFHWSFDASVELPKIERVAKMFDGHIPIRFDFAAGTEKAEAHDKGSFDSVITGAWTKEADLKTAFNPGHLANCIQIVGAVNGTSMAAIDGLKAVILRGQIGYEALLMPTRI